MENCKICNNNFKDSPDMLVLCKHKDGMVHKGCCVDRCSIDRKPCVHALSQYSKVTK